jgi:hypothetical protein
MGWFKLGLLTGHSFRKDAPELPAGEASPSRVLVG